MKRNLAILLSAILIAVLLAGCSFKQIPYGNLSGLVTWQTTGSGNSVVVGVTVNVWGDENKRVASGVTDSTGRYTINKIRAGQGYLVTCYQSATGETVTGKNWMIENVSIKPDATAQLDLAFENSLKGGVLPETYR